MKVSRPVALVLAMCWALSIPGARAVAEDAPVELRAAHLSGSPASPIFDPADCTASNDGTARYFATVRSTTGGDIPNASGRLVFTGNTGLLPPGQTTTVNLFNGDFESQAADGNQPSCVPAVNDGHPNDLGSPFVPSFPGTFTWKMVVTAPGFVPFSTSTLATDGNGPCPLGDPDPIRAGCLISIGIISLQPLGAPLGRGVVAGSVFDPSGRLLDGATVVLTDANAGVHTKMSGTNCIGAPLPGTGFYCFDDFGPGSEDGVGLPPGVATVTIVNNTPANCGSGSAGPAAVCGLLPATLTVNVAAGTVTGQDITLQNKFAPAPPAPQGAGAFGYVVNGQGQGVGGLTVTGCTNAVANAAPCPAGTGPVAGLTPATTSSTGLWTMSGLPATTSISLTLSGPGVTAGTTRPALTIVRVTGAAGTWIDPSWILAAGGTVPLPTGSSTPTTGSPTPTPTLQPTVVHPAGTPPSIVANVQVQDAPSGGLAVNPSTNRVYVSGNNVGSHSVSVINGSTNSVIARALVGSIVYAGNIAVDDRRNRAYVGDTDSRTVRVVDGATNALIGSILLEASPNGLAVNRESGRVYVTHWDPDGRLTVPDRVSVIDGASSAVVSTIPIGDGAAGVAVNEVTNRAYAVNAFDNSLSVINTITNAVIATVSLGNPVNGFGGTPGVAVNPITNRVYAANQSGGTVVVIDGATNAVVTTIPVGTGPTGVAVNPEGNRIYVSRATLSSGNVVVIDGGLNQVVASLTINLANGGVAANPVTNRFYISSNDYRVWAIQDFPLATVTAPPTAAPTTTPTATSISGLGGTGFGITPGNSVTMTWSPGSGQLGYVIVRFSATGQTVFPSTGTFPPATTSFTDSPGLSEPNCYMLGVVDRVGAIKTSDLLCLFPNRRIGDAPRNFTIRLNQSSTASFSWDPPSGGTQTRYSLLPFGASAIDLPGSATGASHTMAGATCYALVAATDAANLGATDILCGLPGFATLSDQHDPARMRQ